MPVAQVAVLERPNPLGTRRCLERVHDGFEGPWLKRRRVVECDSVAFRGGATPLVPARVQEDEASTVEVAGLQQASGERPPAVPSRRRSLVGDSAQASTSCSCAECSPPHEQEITAPQKNLWATLGTGSAPSEW